MKDIIEFLRKNESGIGIVFDSLAEVADYYKKPVRTFENFVYKGLPREKVGNNKYRYYFVEIQEWMQENLEINDTSKSKEYAELSRAIYIKQIYRLHKIIIELCQLLNLCSSKNKKKTFANTIIESLQGKLTEYRREVEKDQATALKYLGVPDRMINKN